MARNYPWDRSHELVYVEGPEFSYHIRAIRNAPDQPTIALCFQEIPTEQPDEVAVMYAYEICPACAVCYARDAIQGT